MTIRRPNQSIVMLSCVAGCSSSIVTEPIISRQSTIHPCALLSTAIVSMLFCTWFSDVAGGSLVHIRPPPTRSGSWSSAGCGRRWRRLQRGSRLTQRPSCAGILCELSKSSLVHTCIISNDAVSLMPSSAKLSDNNLISQPISPTYFHPCESSVLLLFVAVVHIPATDDD